VTPLAWAAVAVAALLLLGLLGSYNRFVRQRTLVEESWGGIDVELSRRRDLIPLLVEAYPDLKASQGFLGLQTELTNTEDRIAASRRFYNGNVRAYNTRVRTLPSNLVATLLRFDVREFFELREPVPGPVTG